MVRDARPQEADGTAADEIDAGVEAAIRACDGDARAAVKALVIANHFLEAELESAVKRLSAGYVHGKLRLATTRDIGMKDQ